MKSPKKGLSRSRPNFSISPPFSRPSSPQSSRGTPKSSRQSSRRNLTPPRSHRSSEDRDDRNSSPLDEDSENSSESSKCVDPGGGQNTVSFMLASENYSDGEDAETVDESDDGGDTESNEFVCESPAQSEDGTHRHQGEDTEEEDGEGDPKEEDGLGVSYMLCDTFDNDERGGQTKGDSERAVSVEVLGKPFSPPSEPYDGPTPYLLYEPEFEDTLSDHSPSGNKPIQDDVSYSVHLGEDFDKERESSSGGKKEPEGNEAESVNYCLNDGGVSPEAGAVNYSISYSEEEGGMGAGKEEAQVNYSLCGVEEARGGGNVKGGEDSGAVNYSMACGTDANMGGKDEEAVNYSLCGGEEVAGNEENTGAVNYSICEEPYQRPRSKQLKSGECVPKLENPRSPLTTSPPFGGSRSSPNSLSNILKKMDLKSEHKQSPKGKKERILLRGEDAHCLSHLIGSQQPSSTGPSGGPAESFSVFSLFLSSHLFFFYSILFLCFQNGHSFHPTGHSQQLPSSRKWKQWWE